MTPDALIAEKARLTKSQPKFFNRAIELLFQRYQKMANELLTEINHLKIPKSATDPLKQRIAIILDSITQEQQSPTILIPPTAAAQTEPQSPEQPDIVEQTPVIPQNPTLPTAIRTTQLLKAAGFWATLINSFWEKIFGK